MSSHQNPCQQIDALESSPRFLRREGPASPRSILGRVCCIPFWTTSGPYAGAMIEEYSTSQLEELLTEIPRMLKRSGVKVSPVSPTSSRQPDFLFVDPVAVLEDVIELIEIMSPRVVYLQSHAVESHTLFDGDQGDLEGVAEVAALARKHEGELYMITLSWVADSQLSSWFATTGWYDDLNERAELAVAVAKGLADDQREQRLDANRKQYARCRSAILDSRSFRQATPGKRTVVARLCLSELDEELGESWMERHLLQDVRSEARIQVANFEGMLGDRLGEVVEQVRESDGWEGLSTKAEQTRAIADLLRELAEGWALSASFVETVRLAASTRGRIGRR